MPRPIGLRNDLTIAPDSPQSRLIDGFFEFRTSPVPSQTLLIFESTIYVLLS